MLNTIVFLLVWRERKREGEREGGREVERGGGKERMRDIKLYY